MTPAGDPRIDGYDWAGGREAMLRFGPEHGPTVIVALPLLEEANRTRALAGWMLRALAARGIAGALPDMPGTGESLIATADLRLADLRAAFAAAAAACHGLVASLAIRSGALYSSIPPLSIASPRRIPGSSDETRASGQSTLRPPVTLDPGVRRSGAEGGAADSDRGEGGGWRWQLSPQTGVELVREWRRLGDAGDGETVAGNRIGADLWAELMEAEPLPARVVRLTGDPRPADRTINGSPPWRRAEPDGDPALAARLADDIADWIAACAA